MLFGEINDQTYQDAHILTYNWLIERNYEFITNRFQKRRYEMIVKKNEETILIAIYKRDRDSNEINTSFNFKRDRFEGLIYDASTYGYDKVLVSHYEHIEGSNTSFHVVASRNYIWNVLNRTKHLNIYFNKNFRTSDTDDYYASYVREKPNLSN